MSIEFILLGHLSKGYPLTAYDMKKCMEHSTEFFASTSLGAIHPTLVKLEARGYATSFEETKNNRMRKLYTITSLGKEAFLSQLRTDFGPDKFKSNQLLKVFFFNHLSHAEQLTSIDQYIGTMETMHQQLTAIKTEGIKELAKHGLTLQQHEPTLYQMDSLAFGLAYSQFVAEWFTQYKEVLKERLNEKGTHH